MAVQDVGLVQEVDAGREVVDIRAMARSLAVERYRPQARQWDADRAAFPKSERRYLGSLGLLGMALPEEYGGSGAPLSHALTVVEELAKECRPAAFQIFEANTGPAQVIGRLGTPRQKERLLPAIIAGDAALAVAISEPDAGSGATDMRTRVDTRPDGTLVLSGSKRWISNGGEAECYLVYARFEDTSGAGGIGAVLVDATAPGVSFGEPERLMGFRGIPSSDIYFDEVELSPDDVLIGPGGFKSLFRGFSIERLGNATMSLGIAQAALDKCLVYVDERQQFGKKLVEFQAIQLTLADMAMKVEGSRLLIERAADFAPGGYPNSYHVSLAKCTANEMAKQVTDLAMQIHGGNGYSEEYGLERLHRDAHGWAIAGGTPTMQRIRIVSELMGRRLDQRR